MPLVSITRLRVRSFRYLPAFLLGSLRAAREAKNASGNLAVAVLSDANLTFWTRTLWIDERSMRAFMFAPAHRRVMPKLLQWCDEASPEPPPWQEVHRRLQQEGRVSKVDHPSAAQLRFEIPPPKTTRQLKLK
ncbi:MAG: DUF3291 domain-containing protein [Xanthobacteraceae bacterium]